MSNFEKATFGAGCFWCSEAVFQMLDGVKEVISGYVGPSTKSGEAPTYEEVSTGKTLYAEAIQITYNSQKISYEKLLEVFWDFHDPTALNRQGPDIGRQYRSVIFYSDNKQKKLAEDSKKKLEKSGKYKDPIVTEIVHLEKFYKAEDYHQNYYKNNKNAPYCEVIIKPKIEKIEEEFKDLLKKNGSEK